MQKSARTQHVRAFTDTSRVDRVPFDRVGARSQHGTSTVEQATGYIHDNGNVNVVDGIVNVSAIASRQVF